MLFQAGVIVHASDTSTREAKVIGSQGQPGPQGRLSQLEMARFKAVLWSDELIASLVSFKNSDRYRVFKSCIS